MTIKGYSVTSTKLDFIHFRLVMSLFLSHWVRNCFIELFFTGPASYLVCSWFPVCSCLIYVLSFVSCVHQPYLSASYMLYCFPVRFIYWPVTWYFLWSFVLLLLPLGLVLLSLSHLPWFVRCLSPYVPCHFLLFSSVKLTKVSRSVVSPCFAIFRSPFCS